MSIDRNDPRLTAYALGEMPTGDAAAFAAELAADPAARDEIRAIRAVADTVGDTLRTAEVPGLTAGQREAILSCAAAPSTGRQRPPMRIWALRLAAAAAVLTLLGVLIWPFVQPSDPGTAAGPNAPVPPAVSPRQGEEAEQAVETVGPPAPTYSLEAAPDIDRLAGVQTVPSPGVPRTFIPVVAPDPLEVDMAMRQDPTPTPLVLLNPNHPLVDTDLHLNVPPYLGPIPLGVTGVSATQEPTIGFYAQPQDNPFADVFLAPISRLPASADVASWAYVRQTLQAGDLPHPRGVRLEGLVNYMDYAYPAPTSEAVAPFAMGSSVYDCPWNPGHQLVRLSLTTTAATRRQPEPDLVVVVDLSGSMHRAGRLPLFRRTFSRLYRGGGSIAVVAAAPDETRFLVLEGDDSRAAAIAAVAGLEKLPEKAPDHAPVALACRLARRLRTAGRECRIVVVTDTTLSALANPSADLAALVRDTASHGIQIQTLRFGPQSTRDAPAPGGLTVTPVNNVADALTAVAGAIGSPWQPVAGNADVRVEFNPNQVTAYRLLGYEDESLRAGQPETVPGQALGTGEALTFLYEVVPAKSLPTWTRRSTLKYQRLVTLGEALHREMLTWTVTFDRPDGTRETAEDVLIDRQGLFELAPADFRLAAAVAELGLIMRQSPHRGKASLDRVLQVVESATDADPQAGRQLADMVRRYRRLARSGAAKGATTSALFTP